MKKWKSYKPGVADKKFDAIIIGSGIGGLCTAALLSLKGKRVLVLEKHFKIGGWTHTFRRDNYEWDVGIHYIGEVQNPNTAIRKMFDYVSNNQLEWADMGEVYDKIIIGDKTYDFVKGVENFKAQMIEYFPNESKAIQEYINLVFDSNKNMKKFYLEKTLPNFISAFLGFFLKRKYLKDSVFFNFWVVLVLQQ